MNQRNVPTPRHTSRCLLIAALGACSALAAAPAFGGDCELIDDGLVSWWPADGDARDVHSAHDGTLVNGAAIVPGPVPGTEAFGFDGVDDYITVPATPGLDMTSSYSFEAWIQSTGPSSSYRVIAVRGSGNENDVEIYIQAASNDLIVVHNRGNGGQGDYVGFSDPPAGVRFHLAVTFDGSVVRAFYDGVEPPIVQQSAAMAEPVFTNKGWEFGRTLHSAFSGVRHFKGVMDEISLYAHPLDLAEIQAITAAGFDGKCRDDDHDGLIDDVEIALGTDPDDADTDGDSLDDGTEVAMADGGACPDPLAPDSDGDTLLDGDELALGTNSCSADTDGDGVSDATDPIPNEPGVPGSFLEEWTRLIGTDISVLDLDVMSAKNDKSRAGKRNALSNQMNEAANLIAAGEYDAAIDLLEGIERKLDGQASPKDWLIDGPEKDALLADVEDLVFLIEFLP